MLFLLREPQAKHPHASDDGAEGGELEEYAASMEAAESPHAEAESERVRTLPIDASDDEIKDLVVDWSELLAEKRYAEALSAFPYSTQEYDWTPELLERVIDGYGVVDPDPDVIRELREDHGVAQFEVTTLRGRLDCDEIVGELIDVEARKIGGDDELGWVHYCDVPLNGFRSDLTARFIIRRIGANRLTLEFYDLHVM